MKPHKLVESQPVSHCCSLLAAPISSCHRTDVTAGYKQKGMNLWCPCCGRFWKGQAEEVIAAEQREDELENDI